MCVCLHCQNCSIELYHCFFKYDFVMTAWAVAGEYVYTTAGDQDTDYLMLTLNVPGYR